MLRAVALVACLGLCWSLGSVAAGIATGSYGASARPQPPKRPLANDAARTGQEMEELRRRMRELARRKAEHKEQRDLLHQELQRAEETVAELGAKLHQITQARALQLERLQRIRPRLEAQQGALGRQRQALAGLIRAAFLVGRRSELELLLNQRDPRMASRLMLYYDYLHRSRSEEIRRLQQAVTELQALTAKLDQEEAALRRTEAELSAEKARMETAQAARSELVQQLDKKIQGEGLSLEEMQADNRRLDALFDQLLDASSQRFAAVNAARAAAEPAADPADKALAGDPPQAPEAARTPRPADDPQPQPQRPFAALAGRLAWPAGGELDILFGARKASGLTWDGVVIAAPEGAEVRAVYPGVVVFADWLRGFGLLLIVDHGDDYMTLYGQNQTLFKAVGERVRAGEVVGLAGRSGGREEPGVYFGVRHRGRPQNPTHWCGSVRDDRVG